MQPTPTDPPRPRRSLRLAIIGLSVVGVALLIAAGVVWAVIQSRDAGSTANTDTNTDANANDATQTTRANAGAEASGDTQADADDNSNATSALLNEVNAAGDDRRFAPTVAPTVAPTPAPDSAPSTFLSPGVIAVCIVVALLLVAAMRPLSDRNSKRVATSTLAFGLVLAAGIGLMGAPGVALPLALVAIVGWAWVRFTPILPLPSASTTEPAPPTAAGAPTSADTPAASTLDHGIPAQPLAGAVVAVAMLVVVFLAMQGAPLSSPGTAAATDAGFAEIEPDAWQRLGTDALLLLGLGIVLLMLAWVVAHPPNPDDAVRSDD